jgi:hypothetical protein
MSTLAKVRSILNLQRLTGQVFVRRAGATNWIDMGNATEFDSPTKADRVVHETAVVGQDGGGYVRGDSSQVHTVHEIINFMTDSMTIDVLQLLNFSDAPTNVDQAAAGSVAVTAQALVKGQTFYLGATSILTATLTADSVAMVEGADYTIDKKNGMITILTTSTVVTDGDALAGTVSVAAVKRRRFKPLSKVAEPVFFRIYFNDASKSDARVLAVGEGDLYPVDFGKQDHKNYKKAKFEFLVRESTLDERLDDIPV